jgi:hypothetical protein
MARSRAVNRIGVFCVVFLMLATLLATSSAATVIRAGSGNAGPPPPGDDPGWANVSGRIGAVGTAVYLGDQWVLTAAHVGGGTVELGGGVQYYMDPGSWQPLHDPNDPSKLADLGLFRLTAPPGLPNLAISQSAPADGARVVGIGYGRDQASSETWWNSDWEKETGSEAYRGFELPSSFIKRWGENYIDPNGQVAFSLGGYTTHALQMTFDQSGSPNEMQAVPGDSGGGLFYKNGSDWELAGIWIARTTYSQGDPKQPDATAVYGNLSYAADLSRYRSQIMAIVPEPSMLVMLLGVGMGCLVWSFWRRASR